ncbi:MAG: hypothetical protein BMS9Abin32_036 [Gammaproteobacteria bacterium]|nr:MAG: hypothetical protein BMS9Abin32_036 [Gammaproteobacteria bacterium]
MRSMRGFRSSTGSVPCCRLAVALATTALLGLPYPGAAEVGDLRLPISLDADATDYDGKNSMLMFKGLRLTQGSTSVQADEGRATKLDFEDSVWHFNGNVVIDTEDGHIECDAADVEFTGHQLRLATITGTPATFEMRRPGNDEVTRGQAQRLEYDFAAGVIEFTGDAVITENGNQISSSYLVYNIEEQRISAQSGGNGDPKVKIIYTPRDTTPVPAANPASEDDGGGPAESGAGDP